MVFFYQIQKVLHTLFKLRHAVRFRQRVQHLGKQHPAQVELLTYQVHEDVLFLGKEILFLKVFFHSHVKQRLPDFLSVGVKLIELIRSQQLLKDLLPLTKLGTPQNLLQRLAHLLPQTCLVNQLQHPLAGVRPALEKLDQLARGFALGVDLLLHKELELGQKLHIFGAQLGIDRAGVYFGTFGVNFIGLVQTLETQVLLGIDLIVV